MNSFKITILPADRVFCANEGEVILAAGMRQGVGLAYGCKDGACGTCKSKMLEGQVAHGPHQLKALSREEEAAGFVLTCCALPLTDVVLESRQVTGEGAFPIRKFPARVSSIAKRSHDVMVVELQLPAGIRYHAGQYIEFLLADGLRRSYSMANASHVTRTAGALSTVELHIRHMPGGTFTDRVFHRMKERELLRAEGPYGSFFLREDSTKPIILLASGTGFAPIKAIIEHMQFKGIDRPASLYWGGRRPADLYLDAWVRARQREMPNLKYHPIISNPLPADNWAGRTGFVHRAVLEDFPDLSAHQVYACGAPIVVDSARADYIGAARLPADEFFADSFTTEADKHPR